VEGAQGPPAMPVKVQAAELRKVGDFTEYIATLRSRHASVLQPEVEGQVTRILVRAGQAVKAGQALLEIDPREQERPTIPVTAISHLAGQTFAFVAANEGGKTVARQRSVRLGEVVGNDYVVLEGISAGDKVIISGVQMLADGMPVAPVS